MQIKTALAVLAVVAGYFAAALAALAFTRENGNVATLWPADAIAISALLLGRRQLWPGMLTGFAATGAVANMLIGDTLATATAFAVANIANILVAVILCRRWCSTRTLFVRPDRIMLFIAATAMIAPAVSALIGATAAAVLAGTPFWRVLPTWYLADAVGALVVIPCIAVATLIRRHEASDLYVPRRRAETAILFGLVALVSVMVFNQDDRPLLFLVLPFVLLATMRLGPIGAAAGTLIVALIGGVATSKGLGPIALIRTGQLEHVMFFQLFIASIFVSTLPVGAFLAQRNRLLRKVQQREREYRTVVESIGEVIFRTDAAGRWTYLNSAWETMTGVSVPAALGTSFMSYVLPDDRARALENLAALYDGRSEACRQDVRFAATDGSTRWASVLSQAERNAEGAVTGTFGTLRDISDRKAAEDALAENEERYRLLADNAADVVLRLSADGICRYASPSSYEMTGHHPDEVVGRSTAAFIHRDDLSRVLKVHNDVVAGTYGSGAATVDYRSRHGDGRELWLETTTRRVLAPDGSVDGVISAIRDITWRKALEQQLTEARDAAEAAARELHVQAATDALTGLASRRYFMLSFEAAMREQERTTLGIIDLDHFKRINDGYGHDAGDAVLRHFAETCRNVLSGQVTGRLGGEEFGVLLSGMAQSEASAMLERLRETIAASPLCYHGTDIAITISIGAAQGQRAQDPADLLLRADRALYGAKREGRNRLLLAA